MLEHISTKAAVDFIQESSSNIAATITVHHLLYNRNHLLAGGIKPHYYCLPILKHEQDQKALQQAAISMNPKFFAGTVKLLNTGVPGAEAVFQKYKLSR